MSLEVPEVLYRFLMVPGGSLKSLKVLKVSGGLLRLPGYSGLLGYSRLLWATSRLGYSRLLLAILGYSRLLLATLGYSVQF